MKNILMENNEVIESIPNILDRAEHLSTEGMGSAINKVADFFISKLSLVTNIFNNNSERIDDIHGITVEAKKLYKVNKYIPDILSKLEFRDIAAIEVPVPVGFKGSLYTSVMNMGDVVPSMENILLSSLEETDYLISKLLSSEDFRKSTKPIKVDKSYAVMYKKYNSIIEDAIDPNSTIDRVAIKNILPNLNSITEISSTLDNINRKISYKGIEVLKTKSVVIADRVTMLIESLSRTDVNIEKSKLKELSAHIESSAKLLTVGITVYYLATQLTSVTTHVIESLKKRT